MFVKAEAPEHRAHACDSGGSHPDLAAGDPEELFTQLFDTYAPALRSYFAGRVGVHLADDVVAETFLLALRKRATYDPSRGPVRAWLYGIATNVLRGYTRKELRGLRATDVTGVAVGVDDSDIGQRRELVLNPRTGEFIGARVVALDGNDLGVSSGTVLWALAPELV